MFNAHTPAPPDDAGSVKVRILAAGRSEFARRGLAAGSVRVIAQQAGVTAAMINYYFGGKRGLYDAVVADAQERLRAHLAPALAPGRGGARGAPGWRVLRLSRGGPGAAALADARGARPG